MCCVPIPLLVGVIPAGVVRQHLLKRGNGVPLVIALDLAANHNHSGRMVDRHLRAAVQVEDGVVRVATNPGDEDRCPLEVALQLDGVHGESPFKVVVPDGAQPLQDGFIVDGLGMRNS